MGADQAERATITSTRNGLGRIRQARPLRGFGRGSAPGERRRGLAGLSEAAAGAPDRRPAAARGFPAFRDFVVPGLAGDGVTADPAFTTRFRDCVGVCCAAPTSDSGRISWLTR